MQNAHDVLRQLVTRLRFIREPGYQTILDQIETLTAPYMTPVQGEEWTRFGITPLQTRMVCLLHTRLGKLVTRDGLMEAMWFDDPESGDKAPNNVSVQIHRIRGILAGHYSIETVAGRGYIMHRVVEPAKVETIAA